MPYSEISEPVLTAGTYSASVSGHLPGDETSAMLGFNFVLSVTQGAEAPDPEALDAWFQQVLDLMAQVPGAELVSGGKGYTVGQMVTPTTPIEPPAEPLVEEETPPAPE